MKPDHELLRQYAANHSEDAFAELVSRHVNLVYSAALRQVGGDAHLARDAAQNVFTDLARKAASLSRRESLTGWLYTSAYFAANKIVRTETRRRQREEQFMREPTHTATPDADWEQLRPALDAVMHELNETDREAVLLRYFENRAFAEVGAKLNLNENAARMRVDRALEKLRTLLAKRGITAGAALASIISANAVQTAPGTLAPALASASLAGASTGGLFQLVNAMKFKIGASALVVASAAIILTANRNLHATPRTEKEPATQPIAQTQNANASAPDSLLSANDSGTNASNQASRALKPASETSAAAAPKIQMAFPPQATNSPAETNKIVISLKIRFASFPAENLQALRPAWPGGDSGILTADQFNFVNQALKHAGNYSMTASEIIAFSGQQAAISERSPVLIDGTNASIDMMFGVTPYFSPESSTFRLDLFVESFPSGEDSSASSGAPIGKTNELTLSPGQVAVLQREIPSELLPPDGAAHEPKEFMVFVTPESSPTAQTVDTFREQTYFGYREKSTAKVCLADMTMYAKDHNNQYPVNFDQVQDGNPEIRRFEIAYQGYASNILHPSSAIIVREIQPWQYNGNWARTYGFADGHTEIHTEANNNFDTFEREHAAVPAN